MRLSLSALILSALLTACASAPPPPPDLSHATATYDTTFDEAWTAVIGVFAAHNYPIDAMEKDSGIITTDWGLAPKEWMACGSAQGFGHHDDYQGKYNVFVRDRGAAGVEVQINTQWQAAEKAMSGRTDHWDACTTTGVLERDFQNELAAALAAN